MDTKTIDYYDSNARVMADFYESLRPEKLYEQISLFFQTNDELTVDLGCGSGRDTAYLKAKDYKVIGIDASEGMLREAKARHPGIEFRIGKLPELCELRDASVDNMLCSGVFMHLPEEDLIPAAMSCRRVMKPQGILILSFRDNDLRIISDEKDSRLFTSISAGRLAMLFESLGMRILHQGVVEDAGKRGYEWNTLVIQNTATVFTDGITRIQRVLEHDKKTATYKLALIRALCQIALKEPACAQWKVSGEDVLIPVRKIAEYWLKFYWNLEGIKQTTGGEIAFGAEISKLKKEYRSDFSLISKCIDDDIDLPLLSSALKKIALTLVRGPVHHSGSRNSPIFSYWGNLDTLLNSGSPRSDALNHFISVPAQIWRDLLHFNQWIHDSVQVRWAELTVEVIDRDLEFSEVLGLLRKEYEDDLRKTQEVRNWLKERPQNRSIWSGRKIMESSFEVDHIIPFSVARNNDLWNLMPAIAKENRDKSDRIPTQRTLELAREGIHHYWEYYRIKSPNRFTRQLKDALGTDANDSKWPKLAFNHLLEMAERIATTRSLERWEIGSN